MSSTLAASLFLRLATLMPTSPAIFHARMGSGAVCDAHSCCRSGKGRLAKLLVAGRALHARGLQQADSLRETG